MMTDQAKTALAGAAGGIVRWGALRERWQDSDSNGFASFIVGLGAISIAGLLIDLICTRTSKAKGDSDARG